jgi:hypothetical protein
MAALAILVDAWGVNRLFFRRIRFMLLFVIVEAGPSGPGSDTSAIAEEPAATVITIANRRTDLFLIRSAFNSKQSNFTRFLMANQGKKRGVSGFLRLPASGAERPGLDEG